MAKSTSRQPHLAKLDTLAIQQHRKSEYQGRTPGPSVEDELLCAVSDVLGVPQNTIDLIDSFGDLGGDEKSAAALQQQCTSAGLRLQTNDILQCRTLAQLQTCITPLTTADLTEGDSENDVDEPPEGLAHCSPGHSSDDDKLSLQTLERHFRYPLRALPDVDTAEELVLSTGLVAGAAFVKPKAGFLEGNLVAFMASSSSDASNHNVPSIQSIHRSQMQPAGSPIAAIKLSLERADKHITMPDAWIMIDHMPANSDGEFDRRYLQTWVQNMNEETYQQVMSLESEELLPEPLTDLERTIQRATSRVLRISEHQVGMDVSFAQLGGDEVSSTLLAAACRTQGINLRVEDIFQSTSLAQVASAATYNGQVEDLWDDESPACFEPAPMQRFALNTTMGSRPELGLHGNGQYGSSQSFLLKVKSHATLEDIHAAVETTVAHHAMLRSRSRLEADDWTLRILPSATGSYGFGYHHVEHFEEISGFVEQTENRIDIENGPVFAVEYFRTFDNQQMILLAAHHLVVDRTSWRIIIHDLDELLRAGTLFSERSVPFQTWSNFQQQKYNNLTAEPLANLSIPSCNLSYWGLDKSFSAHGKPHKASFTISAELTTLLHTTCNQAFQTDSADIFLAALYLSFVRTFSDRPPPTIWNQDHERAAWSSNVHPTETVGWLASLYPVGLRSAGADDLIHILRDIKDTKTTVSCREWNYLASNRLSPYTSTHGPESWPVEILFTHLGSRQQLDNKNGVLELTRFPARTTAPNFSDFYSEANGLAVFAVHVEIDHGCSKVSISYSNVTSHEEKILEWSQSYEHLIYEAIGRLRYRAPELTLADVPLLNTDYEGLAKLNTDRLIALGLSNAREIEDVYPATGSQQEILMSQIRNMDVCHSSSVYELSCLNGEQADETQICSVWKQIVSTHPVLRAVFIDSITTSGIFDQVILRTCSPSMLFFDATPGLNPQESLQRLPPMPSNPSQPRHRLSVCKGLSGMYIMLEASQAICDGRSVQLLMADFKRIYNSGKAPLKPLGPSHAFSMKHINSMPRAKSFAYWLSCLSGLSPCTFPCLLPYTSKTGIRISHFEFDISLGKMDSFCRSYDVNRADVLRLAWGLVLRSFTGFDRVCFGFRTSGRDGKPSLEGLPNSIGCFENTIPIFMELFPFKSIEAALSGAKDIMLCSLDHQHIRPSEIEQALHLKGVQLFNTCMTYVEDLPELRSRFSNHKPQLQLSCKQISSTDDKDLSLSAIFVDDRLSCSLSQRILSDAHAQSLITAFRQALIVVVTSPSALIGACLPCDSVGMISPRTLYIEDVRFASPNYTKPHQSSKRKNNVLKKLGLKSPVRISSS